METFLASMVILTSGLASLSLALGAVIGLIQTALDLVK